MNSVCNCGATDGSCPYCTPINPWIVSAPDSNKLLCGTNRARLENVQRVFKKMHRNLDLRNDSSALIDLINHAETLVEEVLST